MSNSAGLAFTEPEHLVRDFASRGIVVLPPERLGVTPGVHERIFRRKKELIDAGVRPTSRNVPQILQVLSAPGLVAACNRLAGDNWAVVPFASGAGFTSGAYDQHWHKDDNGPLNGRKQRHHQAVQVEMLYFPQAVGPAMGPTATVPYSQYWTFNHEENHDNFAGADHLDFAFQIEGLQRVPVSGPDSPYAAEEIASRRTAHDIRMRKAVAGTGWPLVRSFEVAPLPAGSVVLYSHNVFHRGNHRVDDWRSWQDNPRFMWRFWIYRTTDPDAGVAGNRGAGSATDGEVDWRALGTDPLTGIDLNGAGDEVTVLWRYHDHWMRTGQAPPPRPEAARLAPPAREQAARHWREQLYAMHDAAEPKRIGAAYQIASCGDTELAVRLLGEALYHDRESVRRAATYGLVAVGPAATDVFLQAVRSPVKWVRKAGVYGLGDASPLTEAVLQAVTGRLRDDPSVYVRSVAAGTLGCLVRRAVAAGQGVPLIPACVTALVESLGREPNRSAMDRAQGRSIKFTRPTDDCDVCEGGAFDPVHEQFAPVRSAVRENALWSLVIVASHGTAVIGSALEPLTEALHEVVRSDQNLFCVGSAMDALARLTHLTPPGQEPAPEARNLRDEVIAAVNAAPVRAWDSLVCSGFDTAAIKDYADRCSSA